MENSRPPFFWEAIWRRIVETFQNAGLLFRIHLATAVLLMVLGSAILGMNLVERRQETYQDWGRSTLIMQERSYGWPVTVANTWIDVWAPKGKFEEGQAHASAWQLSFPGDFGWNWPMLGLNLLIWGAMMAGPAMVFEWAIRRKRV